MVSRKSLIQHKTLPELALEHLIIWPRKFLNTSLIRTKGIFSVKNSDIWSLGIIIYEMCNLRLPFEAQHYNALAIKILKGSFPSITPTYSKQLRDLIILILSPKPQNRPSIVDIMNKPFIRPRI